MVAPGARRCQPRIAALRTSRTAIRRPTRVSALSVIFRENPPDYDYDWHRAPQRQLPVLLDGAIEIEVSGGERRAFSGGELLLLEDTTGRSHRTRTTDGRSRRSLSIPLPERGSADDPTARGR